LTFFSFALVSMLVEVDIVSLSNGLPVLGCPIHRGNNKISLSPVVKQVEVRTLSSPQRYAENIHHVSQEGAYCHMIPSHEWIVLLELNGYLFPLRSTTAFKFSFERSINRRNSLGSCCWTRASMRKSTLYSTISWSPEKEMIKRILTPAEQKYRGLVFQKFSTFQSKRQFEFLTNSILEESYLLEYNVCTPVKFNRRFG
jgi:hypothetical protein